MEIKNELNFPSTLVIFVEAFGGEAFENFYRRKIYEKNNFHIFNRQKFSGKMQKGGSS